MTTTFWKCQGPVSQNDEWNEINSIWKQEKTHGWDKHKRNGPEESL